MSLCALPPVHDALPHTLHPHHIRPHRYIGTPLPPTSAHFTKLSPHQRLREGMPTARDVLGPKIRAVMLHHIWVGHPGFWPAFHHFGHMTSCWGATATILGSLGAAQNLGKQKPGAKSEGQEHRKLLFGFRIRSHPLLPAKNRT